MYALNCVVIFFLSLTKISTYSNYKLSDIQQACDGADVAIALLGTGMYDRVL